MRPVSRLPDVFIGPSRGASNIAQPAAHRRGLAFTSSVIERQGADSPTRSVQTHARHILLRISPQLTTETAARRLVEYKRQIEAGEVQFEKLARDYSEDGSPGRRPGVGWGPASCPSSRKR